MLGATGSHKWEASRSGPMGPRLVLHDSTARCSVVGNEPKCPANETQVFSPKQGDAPFQLLRAPRQLELRRYGAYPMSADNVPLPA